MEKKTGATKLKTKTETVKPPALLATPRSGSTPLYQILALYYQQNHGMQPVYELLNPYSNIYREVDGGLLMEPADNLVDTSMLTNVFDERVRLAKKYHGKVFLKIFVNSFYSEPFKNADWLADNYDFITIERRDFFDQFLSFMISVQTKQWYTVGGIRIPDRSVTAGRGVFDVFQNMISMYLILKTRLKPKLTFIYEDMIKLSPQEILAQAGLHLPVDTTHLNLTAKQNKDDKLSLFTNAEDIKAWYKDSYLCELSPLKI